MSLAQIGEFAFVLLSRASNLHLIEVIFQSVSGARVGQVVGSGDLGNGLKQVFLGSSLFQP